MRKFKKEYDFNEEEFLVVINLDEVYFIKVNAFHKGESIYEEITHKTFLGSSIEKCEKYCFEYSNDKMGRIVDDILKLGFMEYD